MGISVALKRKVIAMYQNGHETEQIAWATGLPKEVIDHLIFDYLQFKN